jgi:hypothetical protein
MTNVTTTQVVTEIHRLIEAGSDIGERLLPLLRRKFPEVTQGRFDAAMKESMASYERSFATNKQEIAEKR